MLKDSPSRFSIFGSGFWNRGSSCRLLIGADRDFEGVITIVS